MKETVKTVASCFVKPGKWENDIYTGAVSVKGTSGKAG